MSSQTPYNQKKKRVFRVLGLRDGLIAVCNYVIGDYRQGGTGLFFTGAQSYNERWGIQTRRASISIL